MSIAVTGASGWLGRATIASLLASGSEVKDIKCFSSKRRTITVENLNFESLPLEELSNCKDIETLVHLAFLTREKIIQNDLAKYCSLNRHITQFVTDFIATAKPISVITISSGAVFDGPEFTSLTQNFEVNPYGYLKLEEEAKLKSVCSNINASLVINRLWGLSGKDIQNVGPYALAEFILRAKREETIYVRSVKEVWRRYVDARELMTLCLKIARSNQSITFNSGGPLVEIGQLAEVVKTVLNSDIAIVREKIDKRLIPDAYYAPDQTYEALLLKYLQVSPLALESQVLQTSLALSG